MVGMDNVDGEEQESALAAASCHNSIHPYELKHELFWNNAKSMFKKSLSTSSDLAYMLSKEP